MITLNDFEVGKTAYLEERIYLYGDHEPFSKLREVVIANITEEHLIVKLGEKEKSFAPCGSERFLVEDRKDTHLLRLYPSMELYADQYALDYVFNPIIPSVYKEAVKAFSNMNMNRYTIDQLRAINKILDGG